ncbi:glycosyltransferase involved in cell wall biosynthesis [Bradyrhizobium sp. GM7.3]
MRIAQVAPLTEAVPPKLYGGTERVVHWLTEELVALGHDVTLFAQRRFADLGEAGRVMAPGAPPRRFRARSQCAAHGDAGAGAAEM